MLCARAFYKRGDGSTGGEVTCPLALSCVVEQGFRPRRPKLGIYRLIHHIVLLEFLYENASKYIYFFFIPPPPPPEGSILSSLVRPSVLFCACRDLLEVIPHQGPELPRSSHRTLWSRSKTLFLHRGQEVGTVLLVLVGVGTRNKHVSAHQISSLRDAVAVPHWK